MTMPAAKVADTTQIWRPQPGPQEKAIRARFVEQLFFGGARGGGKSSYLLGDFASDIQEYGSNWRGVLFRRTYPELDELVEEGKKVLFPAFPGAEYKVGAHEFRIPVATGTVVLRLRHIENEGDADHYQGHCVAKDTLVWMADGSKRAIQQVEVGDLVATLQGPRRVTHLHHPGMKECVEVRHGSRVLQCHPVDHRILTTSSWQSYSSLQGSAATDSSRTSRGSVPTPCVSVIARRPVHVPRNEAHLYPQHEQSAISTPDACRHYGPSYESIASALLPELRLHAEIQPSDAGCGETLAVQYALTSDGIRCVSTAMAEVLSYLGGYPSYPRFYDGPPPALTESVPGGAPSPTVPEGPFREGCNLDDPGNTPRCSPFWDSEPYVHPYTGAPQVPRCRVSSVALTMTPCGMMDVYDLTVEEDNHYITTSQHIVNQNSYTWIGFDELPMWPDLKVYHKLKATLRSTADIPFKRMRATGNPGGPGHNAVKDYFIDVGPEGELYKDLNGERMYIRSLVSDNKILLASDPSYIDRLKDVGDPMLVKAWLEGNWNVFVGQFFNNWREQDILVSSMELPTHWPLFGCLDYGEAKPTAFLLATVDHDGNCYIVAEYYRDNASASQHAYEIEKMLAACPFTDGRRPRTIWADPSMFVKRRLHEVIQQSPADVFQQHGLYLTRANNDRITGWRVVNDAINRRKLYLFDGWCPNLARTMPSLPRDRTNPEDVDTRAEDHAADALRYGLMHMYRPAAMPKKRNRDPFYAGNVLRGLSERARGYAQ